MWTDRPGKARQHISWVCREYSLRNLRGQKWVSERPVSPEPKSKVVLFLLYLVGHRQIPGCSVMIGKRMGGISVRWMVVVVGSTVTLERDSGKEFWSNTDGFPHFSCEEPRVEVNELLSSSNELDDSPWLLYLSRVCWQDCLCPLSVILSLRALILAELSQIKIVSHCLLCSWPWPLTCYS